MAGKGKATRSSKKGKAPPKTSSARAGIIFPVARVNRRFKTGRYAKRVGPSSGAFTAAVLEYLTIEVLELAGGVAQEAHKKTITPRHLMLALGSDDELNKLMVSTTISQGGVVPNIQEALIPSKKGKKATTAP